MKHLSSLPPLRHLRLPLITLLVTLVYQPIALAAPPAKAFGQLPGIHDAAISPDGKRVAVIINNKGTYGVLTQSMQESAEKPWFSSLGTKVSPRYVKWVNNDRYVVSISKVERQRGCAFPNHLPVYQ